MATQSHGSNVLKNDDCQTDKISASNAVLIETIPPFEALIFLIPCEVCRKHYSQHLSVRPVTQHLDRRQDLLKWTIDLHNTVNETLQKPRLLESEVIAYYKRLGARGRTPLWSVSDFAEADMRARIQGVFAGGSVALIACMVLWFTTKSETLR